MIINITFGIIIPWLTLGNFLYKKERKLIFYIVPFGSVIAFFINSISFNLDLYYLKPLELGTLSALPTNLGYFPLIGGLFIYTVRNSIFNNKLNIILFSIFSTALEYNFVISDKIVYSDTWNVFFTFLSYLFAYTVGYYYYLVLNKLKLY